MKVAILNMAHNGSTGKIMYGIADVAEKRGHTVRTFSTKRYTRGKKENYEEKENHTYIGYMWEQALHYMLARTIGYNGCFSYFGTLSLIRKLKKYKPDILNIHNIHGYCMCLPLLMKYIRKSGVKVVWSLHDCWMFTGQCPHFTYVKCDKWKKGCYDCPQIHEYPRTAADKSKTMWNLKKKWFSDCDNIWFIPTSKWLESVMKESYLKDRTADIIYNGIDLEIFKPTKGDFVEKHNLEEKKIVLGVAFGMGEKKGLDVFVELAKRLDNDYKIVLVGIGENIKVHMPDNILCIARTENQQELAKIYTVADVFANPTREETFGLVNVEALACGTPVVSFNSGGSPEIYDEKSGYTVECDDVNAMENKIREVCESKPFLPENCIKRSKNFEKNNRFNEYIDFFEKVVEE